VATAAVEWLCDRFEERTPLYAGVHKNNSSSQRLFKRCEFEKRSVEDNWVKYVYES
jgi:RimJ/RimL family protein N-acetyltransferase